MINVPIFIEAHLIFIAGSAFVFSVVNFLKPKIKITETPKITYFVNSKFTNEEVYEIIFVVLIAILMVAFRKRFFRFYRKRK